MKKKKQKFEGFNKIDNTIGKILDAVYLKEDKSEVIINFAWGKHLHFKPLNNNEESL